MKITPIYNKKIMSKELNPKDLKKIIREAFAKNPGIIKEFDDDEDLDIDLNPDAEAEAAAQADWTPETTQAEKDFAAKLASQFGLGTEPTIKTHEKKFGPGSINEAPLRNTFDTKNLYSFLKDAMFTFMEGDGSGLNYAEAAKFIEQELLKTFDINKKFKIPVGLNEEGNVNPHTKIDRPKDSEGQPITLRARVEDQETGAVGHVVRFGIDDEGKQTVHVDWMQSFGGTIPKSIVHPNTIVVRDETRIVREDEEGGEAYPENSRYMFFGNLQQIQRQAGLMLDMNEEEVNEILESGHDWAQDHIATAKESMDQVFDFLMNETKKESEVEADLEESSIRSHANGRGQNKKPGNFPQTLKRVGMNENFDYAGEERAFHNQPEIDAINKSESEFVENNIPEELRKFYVSGSFEISGPDSDGTKITQYALRIPKQSDETLNDIEKFVKEEIGTESPLTQDTDFGNYFKEVGTYTELEKVTNNWIIKVSIREGKNI